VNYHKILFISSEFPPGPGGIGNQAYNVVRFLNLEEFNVDVATISDFIDKEEGIRFDSAQPFRIWRFKRYKLSFLNILSRWFLVYRLIRRNKYNAIICSGRFSLWTGLIMKHLFTIKTIGIAHGGDINPTGKALKIVTTSAVRSFDTVIAVSRYTAKKLDLHKNQNLKVIPNGLDPNEININRNKRSNLKGNPRLLSVGSLWRRKGQQNVIKKLPDLIHRFPDLHYHCVGFAKEKEYFSQLLNECEVQDKVTFYGMVSRNELFEKYKGADIFFMLSEEQKSGDFEGFGIAVLEANIFGVPAVGSKHSGIEDAISHKFSGIIVDKDNTDEVIEAIHEIISNYDSYSKNARLWAEQHSWSLIIKEYKKIIAEIL
jgi:phosphatidylinositol alpha-1,6-mannosyltransferase